MLTDALGSTVALVDGSGAVQTQYTYEPFGATATSGAANANPAQFTGRENDGTGLYYYRARYYDPRYQRFISEDPIGFGGGDVNLHAYAGNNPTDYHDPSGHFAPLLVLPLAGCLGGAVGAALGNEMTGRKTTWNDVAGGCALGAMIGLAGWAVGPSIAPGAFTTAAAGAPEIDATLEPFSRQPERDGVKSLERSLRSLERNIAEHVAKIDEALKAGGPTSSMERELAAFRHQIDVIKNILGLK